MVFLLSSSQWKTRRASASDVKVHRVRALQNQLGEKESWLLLPGIAFVFFLCKLTELCPCLLNCLSIISLGLSGTQNRTDQLQAPGFLNPTNRPFPGMQQMFLHLRHRLYYLQLATPAGAKPAYWRCRASLYMCICVQTTHTLLMLSDKTQRRYRGYFIYRLRNH